MAEKFGSLLELMQSHHMNKDIVQEGSGFHFASNEGKNRLNVPRHYNCKTCGVVEGKPHYGGSNFAGVDPYVDCTVCGNDL
ncbi:hypothetical protein HNV12_00885 [Methanococcoides sp. SA1]|nr:hypothetical protein [Methanococcoides sp. SA1]